MRTLLRLLAAFTLLFNTAVAEADPVLTFVGGSPLPTLDQTLGWRFDVLVPVRITALDYFDESGDGLHDAHLVGIWDPSGILLTATIIPASSAAPLVNGVWREIGITPLVLGVGEGYIVGGQTFAGPFDRVVCGGGTCDPLAIVTPSEIRYGYATLSFFGGFQRPTLLSVAPDGFFGPNFAIDEAAAVPEPCSLELLLCGLLLLLGRFLFVEPQPRL